MTTISLCVTLLWVIFVCVFAEHEFVMYVNRMKKMTASLKTSSYRDTKSIYNSDFHYHDGDRMEIFCIRMTNACDVKLKYDYLDRIGINGTVTEKPAINGDKKNVNGVGLRTTLRRAHHDTLITCEFACYEHTIRLNIKFILQYGLQDTLNLKINGYDAKLKIPGKEQIYYFRNKSLTFVHDSNIEDIIVSTYRYNDTNYNVTRNKMIIVIPDDNYYLLTYNISRNNAEPRFIYIEFKPFPECLEDKTPLTMNTESSLLELFQFNGNQQIYYEYENGTQVTFICETLPGFLMNSGSYKLAFGNKTSWYKNYVDLNIVPTENNILTCNLSRNGNTEIRRIQLHFRKKTTKTSATVISPSSTMSVKNAQTEGGFPYWVLATIGAVLTIVVVSISTAVWWRRRKCRMQSSSAANNFENQLRGDGSTIRAYPLNWEAYSPPMNPSRDDTYSVPYQVRESDRVSTDQGGTSQDNLNYAVLDISPSTKVLKRTEETPYAEVLRR